MNRNSQERSEDWTGKEGLSAQVHETERRIASLRRDLEVEERVLQRLRAARRSVASRRRRRPAETGTPVRTVKRGSFADEAMAVLEQSGEPMRATDIARALQRRGVSTASDKGLVPQVISALRRRPDLFRRVRRGVYALSKAAEQPAPAERTDAENGANDHGAPDGSR